MNELTNAPGAVLIVGGYGVVGQQAAKILRQRNPDLKLVIAGRDLNRATELAEELGNAKGVVLDIESDEDPLAGIDVPVAAVLAIVNDKENRLMLSCIKNSTAYIDITRWTERVQDAVFEAAVANPSSPVVFSSSWMAGIPAILAAHHARDFAQIENIDMDILYALSDMAGPNSVEYVDRLASKFPILRNGEWMEVEGLSDPKPAEFFSGHKGSTYRFDAPDQVTLPRITNAKAVSTRITYDDQGTMDLMADLVSAGIWSKLSDSKFDDFRISLLYNPGEGGSQEITTTITGHDEDGSSMSRMIMICDPVSQTHLTALGAVIQLEHTLGLDGCEPRAGGIYFAENHRDAEIVLSALKENGVDVKVQ